MEIGFFIPRNRQPWKRTRHKKRTRTKISPGAVVLGWDEPNGNIPLIISSVYDFLLFYLEF
jgi:hypothetical protein